MVLEFIRSKIKGGVPPSGSDSRDGTGAGTTGGNDFSESRNMGNTFTLDDCYESTTSKEVCQMNEKGDFVCNRENQVWKICKGQKPILVSSVKEEGVPTSEIPKIEFKPIFPIFTGDGFSGFDKMFQARINDLMQNLDRFDDDNFEFPSPPPTTTPTKPKSVPMRSDFPEPEHWKK